MTAVLQRLQSLIGDTLTEYIEEDSQRATWQFSKELSKKNSEFFDPLVLAHPVLNLEYSVHCTRLAHSFTRKKSITTEFTEQEKAALTEQLIAALVMAELLTHIYCYYLYVPREVLRLQSEQEVYRTLLRMRGYKFEKQQKTYAFEATSSFTQKVRGTTAMLNWPRLFTVRIRRVLTTLVPVLKDLESYSRLVTFVDQFTGPALNYFTCIYYGPRLLVNIFLLLKHLIPGFWMDQAEKNLYWYTRLQAQLQRRWFELANDTVWLTASLLSCFLLTGPLAGVGMYLTISLFFFDVIMASIRAYIEIKRLKKLQDEYLDLARTMREQEIAPEILAELEEYQQYLEERISVEKQRVLLSVFTTSALFLAMCFALPVLASNPYIPFIGAILVVLITLTAYLLGKWLEKKKPSDKVLDIVKEGELVFATSPHTMFQPADSDKRCKVAPIPYSASAPNLGALDDDLNPIPQTGFF